MLSPARPLFYPLPECSTSRRQRSPLSAVREVPPAPDGGPAGADVVQGVGQNSSALFHEENCDEEQRSPLPAAREVPAAPDGGPAGAGSAQGVAQHSSALFHHVPKVDMPYLSSLRSGGDNDKEDGDDVCPSLRDTLSAAPLQGELREVLCDHQRALRDAAEQHKAAMRLGAEAVLEALGKDLARLLRGGAALQQPQPAALSPRLRRASCVSALGRGEDRPPAHSPRPSTSALGRGAPRPPQPSASHPGRTRVSRRETQSWSAGDVRHTKSMESGVRPTISLFVLARKARQMFATSRRSTDFDDPTCSDVLGGELSNDDPFKRPTFGIFEDTFPARVNKFVESISSSCSQTANPPRRGALADIVNSMAFNTIGNLVILVNSALIVYAANLRVHEDSDPLSLAIAELCFTGWYVLELVLKLTVHRCSYFTGEDRGFNAVDLLLVILSVLEVSLWVVGAWGMIGLDSSFLRTLRVFKVAKLLRMLRALRMFNEIRLMMDCVVQSISSFLWALALLAFLTSLFAVFFVQSVGNAFDQGSLTAPEEEEALLMNFGSVKAAMFSLLKAQSGGLDWVVLYDQVTPLGLLAQAAFVFYIMLMMIAVMNIVASVYLDKAMQVAKPTLETMMLDKHFQDLNDAKELTDMVSEMDTQHSGYITFSDFMRYMKEEKFRLYFDVRGLNVKDTTMFFRMLSSASRRGETGLETDEEDHVDLKTFVMGCMRLKGVASCMDLYTVSWELKVLRAQQSRFMEWAEENFSAPPAAGNGGGAHAVPAHPTVDV